MALSRERIADELLKLLGLPKPAGTVRIMLERGILKPVIPEISAERLRDLELLISAEEAAGIPPDGLRRLAALLPADSAVAESVAVRLKLSNKARKRLACAAMRDVRSAPEALAYRLGIDCAVDRLLVSGEAQKAARIHGWRPPRLPVRGGALIARGLPEGPIVARTLRRIEDRWVHEGFPDGDALEAIVADALFEART
jgi:poly(A) polymerase